MTKRTQHNIIKSIRETNSNKNIRFGKENPEYLKKYLKALKGSVKAIEKEVQNII